MINVSIARRYARALLAVSLEQKRCDEVLGELETITDTIARTPAVQDLFRSPGFSRADRHNFITAYAKTVGLAEPTLSFLKLLVDRGRIEHLEQVTRLYRDLADEVALRVRAEVKSTSPLDPAMAERLRERLTKIMNKTVHLEVCVDESLIGGLVVKIGDRVFDGSVKTQLAKVRKAALS